MLAEQRDGHFHSGNGTREVATNIRFDSFCLQIHAKTTPHIRSFEAPHSTRPIQGLSPWRPAGLTFTHYHTHSLGFGMAPILQSTLCCALVFGYRGRSTMHACVPCMSGGQFSAGQLLPTGSCVGPRQITIMLSMFDRQIFKSFTGVARGVLRVVWRAM